MKQFIFLFMLIFAIASPLTALTTNTSLQEKVTCFQEETGRNVTAKIMQLEMGYACEVIDVTKVYIGGVEYFRFTFEDGSEELIPVLGLGLVQLGYIVFGATASVTVWNLFQAYPPSEWIPTIHWQQVEIPGVTTKTDTDWSELFANDWGIYAPTPYKNKPSGGKNGGDKKPSNITRWVTIGLTASAAGDMIRHSWKFGFSKKGSDRSHQFSEEMVPTSENLSQTQRDAIEALEEGVVLQLDIKFGKEGKHYGAFMVKQGKWLYSWNCITGQTLRVSSEMKHLQGFKSPVKTEHVETTTFDKAPEALKRKVIDALKKYQFSDEFRKEKERLDQLKKRKDEPCSPIFMKGWSSNKVRQYVRKHTKGMTPKGTTFFKLSDEKVPDLQQFTFLAFNFWNQMSPVYKVGPSYFSKKRNVSMANKLSFDCMCSEFMLYVHGSQDSDHMWYRTGRIPFHNVLLEEKDDKDIQYVTYDFDQITYMFTKWDSPETYLDQIFPRLMEESYNEYLSLGGGYISFKEWKETQVMLPGEEFTPTTMKILRSYTRELDLWISSDEFARNLRIISEEMGWMGQIKGENDDSQIVTMDIDLFIEVLQSNLDEFKNQFPVMDSEIVQQAQESRN